MREEGAAGVVPWWPPPLFDCKTAIMKHDIRQAPWNSHLAFWGKTRVAEDGRVFHKPVLHHLLDVAAVAWQLAARNETMRRRLAQALRVDPEDLPPLVAFLAGLHDIGKFTVLFQAKSPDCWPTAILGELPQALQPAPGHWQSTALLLRHGPIRALIASVFPGLRPNYEQLEAISAGHHGKAPDGITTNTPGYLSSFSWSFTEPCVAAAISAVETVRECCGVSSFPRLTAADLTPASFLLNGLITVADWVGSDEAYFPIPETPQHLGSAADYWTQAKLHAAQALTAKGLLSRRAVRNPDYASLGLPCAASLRPMQAMALKVAISDQGPQLFIIEDTTGSGKTEAALMLAARLMATGKAEGLYFALPTTATANAMHGRIEAAYRNFFEVEGEPPSLVLAHGRADLARRLAALRAEGADDGSTSAFCNAWIADSRRLALFADVGVGTIDQAFLAVLRKRFLTLRQFALAQRILIVDEAHAFDPYMGKELEILLQTHARNGGSAIILSATLAGKQREELVKAFIKGRSRPKPKFDAMSIPTEDARTEHETAYPLLTSVSLSPTPTIRHVPVAFDTRLARTVAVQRLNDRQEALTMACAAAARGAAVAIICNAVDEAITVHEQVCARRCGADRTTLFHARFAMGDRLRIEAEVLARFGKQSQPGDRAGHILVGTQVMEQSLDLDFDLVISDLAPVDFIIQRAGRLWRHMQQRPAAMRPLPQPVIAIVSPDPDHVPDDKWLEPVLGKAAHVYRNPAIMRGSAQALFTAGRIAVPDDLRPLVEGVYGGSAAAPPPCLDEGTHRAEGDHHGKTTMAKLNGICVVEGYAALGGAGISVDEDIGTRLGEPTVTVRLARRAGDRLLPYFQQAGADARLCWELSEVSVRKSLWDQVMLADDNAALVATVKKDWPDFEQMIVVAEVDAEGFIRTLRTSSTGVLYNSLTGLRIL